MNIGEAARASGVSAKLIRYYESVGMIPRAGRTAAGYRQYSEEDVRMLRLIALARDLGFSIPDIMGLLSLWHDRRLASERVKVLVKQYVKALNIKLLELQHMKAALQHMVAEGPSYHRLARSAQTRRLRDIRSI